MVASLVANGALLAPQTDETVVVSTASSDVIWRRRTEQTLDIGRKIVQMRERLTSRRRAELSYDKRQASRSRRLPRDRPRPTSTS
jgi:hypothetical protein